MGILPSFHVDDFLGHASSCWRNEQITTNDGDEKAHNHKTGFSPTTDPIQQQCKKEEEGAQTEADI